MNISSEVEKLHHAQRELFDIEVMHILNGQMMFEEFKANKLMGESDYAPFNEAMCVNATTEHTFDEEFINTRAAGHHEPKEGYIEKVITPLANLFDKEYECIVLWFGEDMFCHMNLLTMLSYLEQSGYKGKVFLNSFREDAEFKVTHTELQLGHYDSVYKEVLVNHTKPSAELYPVMSQAINIYLDMLNEDNAVVNFIKKNKDISTKDLLKELFNQFPEVGYGDSQYIELINRTK
ncbi:AraC family transcriptional regulator [Bacillus sp. FJAT-27225]|nr:AraC family transcriptional regulator [Bacillus sp. FJAT-27225]